MVVKWEEPIAVDGVGKQRRTEYRGDCLRERGHARRDSVQLPTPFRHCRVVESQCDTYVKLTAEAWRTRKRELRRREAVEVLTSWRETVVSTRGYFLRDASLRGTGWSTKKYPNFLPDECRSQDLIEDRTAVKYFPSF